ncbi:MAG: putative hydrophobic protein (TIGR00271 family) [Flavobacteriales bacterium]|jgi:uncharacterized hydrophobic protein (TIGR00271 family)
MPTENTYKDGRIENDPTKIDIHAEDIKNLPKSILNFIKDTVSIKDEIDIPETIEGIEKSIPVRGSTVWILICSIIVASVGLNFNSVAVIVGAMLISPLMGPIRGVGLAMATNDFKTLISGLKNFGVMIIVSLFTAFIYFVITPIKGDTSELLGRVKPQAFDILIAFFGGLAGIIASASNNKSAAITIVPGVAIATALMPPLCTLAYGLSIGNWQYAGGAFYLFLLNSVFICLSTVILLRLLKFPKKDFVNPRTERKVKLIIWVSILLIVIPSIYKTTIIVKESIFESAAQEYVDKVIKSDETIFFTSEYIYQDENGNSVIKIYTNGVDVSDEIETQWRNQLKSFELDKTKLKVLDHKTDLSGIQSIADVKAELNLTKEGLANLSQANKDLQNQLEKLESKKVNVKALGMRVKSQFPKIAEISYGKSLNSNNTESIDTLYTFNVVIKDSISELENTTILESLKKALDTEMKISDPLIKSENVRIYRVK